MKKIQCFPHNSSKRLVYVTTFLLCSCAIVKVIDCDNFDFFKFIFQIFPSVIIIIDLQSCDVFSLLTFHSFCLPRFLFPSNHFLILGYSQSVFMSRVFVVLVFFIFSYPFFQCLQNFLAASAVKVVTQFWWLVNSDHCGRSFTDFHAVMEFKLPLD